jgi:undecaprenyl pyrophosphate synthase
MHAGLIGDGVRRWAQQNSLPLAEAYFAAMKNVAVFIDFFFSNSANSISLYMLSKDNLSRPAQDLSAALLVEGEFYRTVLMDLVKKWDCNVHLAGKHDLLPDAYRESIELPLAFKGSSNRRVYLLAAYCPFDELEQAISISPDNFFSSLWVPEKVDLVVRTSGEYRLSQYLPLQSAYAELFFLQKHVNELTIDDCQLVLSQYYKRNRRFGK